MACTRGVWLSWLDLMSQAMCSPPRMLRQLTALNEVSRELASMRSEVELSTRVPEMVTEAFDFDGCSLLMDRDGQLDVAAASWKRDARAP